MTMLTLAHPPPIQDVQSWIQITYSVLLYAAPLILAVGGLYIAIFKKLQEQVRQNSAVVRATATLANGQLTEMNRRIDAIHSAIQGGRRVADTSPDASPATAGGAPTGSSSPPAGTFPGGSASTVTPRPGDPDSTPGGDPASA